MNNEVRILVVDDSKTMRHTLRLILGKNYSVDTAEDGRSGIEAYDLFNPDIILLDLNMPLVDGFGVIEHVRNKSEDQDTVILILTAEESGDFKPKALNAGANDFLYKPFDRTELIARIGVAERQVRLNRQIRNYLRKMMREIELVASLQSRLLPRENPDFKGLSVKSLYKPSGQASGDYFDFFPTPNGIIRVVIADVSGHGARAAFIMAIVRTLFRLSQKFFQELDLTLELINSHLCQIIGHEPDFVTLFAADIDLAGKSLSYINAGHCPGMLKTSSGRVERLAPTSPLLGFFENDFSLCGKPFDKDCELFLFTDGFYEWAPEGGELLDLDLFWKLSKEVLSLDGPFLDRLMERLAGLGDREPRFRDDLTALWLKAER